MESNIRDLSEIFSVQEEDTKKNKECDSRGVFVKDRDKILYSKAFRRLAGKTQVFLSVDDDHVRNRLTHTIEVSQIARTLSKRLKLNEELTEAIALGHDLGHTPFGHVGERTLNFIMCGCDEIKDFKSECLESQRGFKHNWQGLRVITDLESSSSGQGLQLSNYTMWGILNHSNIEYKKCKNKFNGICTLRRNGKECKDKTYGDLSFYKNNEKYKEILKPENLTIEALIVALADEIAQRQHDIEDALETKIVTFEELYKKINETYIKNYNYNCDVEKESFREINNLTDEKAKISKLNSFLIEYLISDATENIKSYLKRLNETNEAIKTNEEFKEYKKDNYEELKKSINLSEKTSIADSEFQKYISKRVLNSHKAQRMDGKGNYIIRELFKAYITNPQQLPDNTIRRLAKNIKTSINNKIKEKGKVTYNINKGYKKSAQLRNNLIKFKYIRENDITVGELRNHLEELHRSNDNLYKSCLMRTICDYIAGMTDRYAMKLYSDLYQTY